MQELPTMESESEEKPTVQSENEGISVPKESGHTFSAATVVALRAYHQKGMAGTGKAQTSMISEVDSKAGLSVEQVKVKLQIPYTLSLSQGELIMRIQYTLRTCNSRSAWAPDDMHNASHQTFFQL